MGAGKECRISAVPPFPNRLEELSAVRQGFVEPADFANFLAAIPDTDVRDFAQWLGNTGQRVGEARKLRWSYIHGDELHIPAPDTKQRRGRVIPLVADLAEIIERRRAVRRLDCPLIFHQGGVRMGRFRQTWQEAMRATGLRITPNTDNATGPAFAVSLSHGPDPDDQVIEAREARVYLEPEIAGQLQDKVLDAQVDDQGEVSFRVAPQSAPPS